MTTMEISSKHRFVAQCPGPLSSTSRYLQSKAVQAPIDGFTTVLPEMVPSRGVFVVDTGELFSALEGEGFSNKSKLERVCRLLGFKPDYLHNAGNDAHVRMLSSSQLLE